MTQPIVVEGLRKRFGHTQALDGLELCVNAGEVHGFLGPNGAGKSTTLRILLGLVRRDAGKVELLGGEPWTDGSKLHPRLAYVPGDVALWPGLTGGEVIDLLGQLRGGLEPARRTALLERFALDPTRRCETYSKGNRQKVALVAALASRAELLLLDEPTSGLDPLMESIFRECILEVRRQGRTVLLSSHILAEVEALCDRVSIVRAGRTVQTGTLAELRHFTQTTIAAEVSQLPAGLDQIAGVHGYRVDGSMVHFAVDPEALQPALLALTRAGIRSLTSQPPTLEELFHRHYSTAPEKTAGAA